MASRQPPARPWFRFASMSRPIQTPTRQAQARATRAAKPSPPVIPPAFTQSFSDAPIQPAVPTKAPTPPPVVAPPSRAAAQSPAPAPKSPPPQAAAVAPSLLPVAPPKSPTSTTFPNAISLVPRVVREELKSTGSPSLSHKPASPAPAPASQEIIRVAPVATAKPLPKPDPSLSPKMKPLTSSPSQLTLPPPQSKSHVKRQEEKPKTALVPEIIEKPKVMPSNLQNHSTEISQLNGKPDVRKDNGNYKKLYDSEEFGKRVVIVAGEDKSAIMKWTPFNTENNPYSLHRNSSNPRTWSDGDKYGSDSGSRNEKGRGKSKDKTYKAMPNSSLPMRAFMNSNVQGVNNSILYNYSQE